MNKTINKKKLGKSVLSLVLVMLMLFSAIPFSTAAATVVPPGQPIVTSPSHNSTPDPAGDPNDYPPDGEAGYAQLTKSAAWTDDETKEEAEITLEAFGFPMETKGVDVVVVFDTSGSMGEPQENFNAWAEPGQRMYETIQAGQAFIDMMLDKQGVFESKNRIALVDFATTAVSRDYGDASEKDALKTWVGNMRNGKQYSAGDDPYYTNDGTDYNAALTETHKLITANLEALAASGEEREQYVVFMTDGDPNFDNYWEVAAKVKQLATVIGVAYQVGEDEYDILRLDVVSKREYPDADGEEYWLIKAPASMGTSEIINSFSIIAAGLIEAGTNAVVVDKINTDAFTLDGTKQIMVQEGTNAPREPRTGEVEVSFLRNEITWNLDTLSAVHKFLIIPVVLNAKYNDGETYILPTNDGDAVLTYTNFAGNDCVQYVKSPELARPNTLVQIVYYKVNEDGHAYNIGGGLTPAGEQTIFDDSYVEVGGEVIDTGTGWFSTTTEERIHGYDGLRYRRYGIADYDSFATSDIGFEVTDLKKTYKVYVGMIEATEAQLTINKTYTPNKPGTVESATFTFTNTTNPSDVKVWNGSGTISLKIDELYDVKEISPKGYLKVQDFQIIYDSAADDMILTGNDSNVTIRKGSSAQGFTLDVTNPHDPDEKVMGDYTVKYYLNGIEQTADEVYREKEIWIYADDIDVDAADVDITNKYGNGYICEEPTVVPATVKSGTVIEVKYITDPGIRAQLTINKTYSPDKPSTVASATFTFTNTSDPTDVQTWNGSGTIDLVPDALYDVKEDAPKGYLNVQDFQVRYNFASDELVLAGNDSNVSVTKDAARNFTLDVTNPYDPNEKITGDYTVKYYIDTVEQTADEVYREKEIWIYADEVDVDAADVNIINKYGNKYICEEPTSVPAAVKSGTVIEVKYITNEDFVARLTIEKTYSPDKPSTVDSAIFTFTNSSDPTDVKTWNGTGTIVLTPDEVYDVKEVAPKGYLNVQDFQVTYDSSADELILTGNDGNVSMTKGTQLMHYTLNITNPYDPNEKIMGDYTVKYYINGTEQTADEIYREKEIWIYADEVDVDAADVNITNKYGNAYICEEPTVVPATVKSGTVIDVKYVTNNDSIAKLTIDKTYSPDKPSTVASATFTFTNTSNPSDVKIWDGSGTIELMPDDVYDVTEVAPKGYLKVQDFQVKYDYAAKELVLTGNDSNVSMTKDSAQNFTLNITNPYDPNEKITGDYTVKYYINGTEQTADEVYREKEIWIYADEVDVDAADVNIVDKYGNGFICEEPTVVPATVKSGTIIEVKYVTNNDSIAKLTINKTYSPDKPSTVASATFTFTNTSNPSDVKTWDGSGTIELMPDDVYDVTEVAPKGYLKVQDFQVKYDYAAKELVLTGNDSNVSMTKDSAQNFTLNITNPYDPNEKITGDYTVKYYINGTEQTADEIYREKEIWIYADEVDVDAADVNIVDKYGSRYICEEPTVVPATVKSGTIIEVKYILDPSISGQITINKTYAPDKPSTVASATFTFTNTSNPSDVKTWNGTGTISLTPDQVYDVKEVAPKGYLKVQDFQVKYDSAPDVLVLTGNDGNVSMTKNSTQNFTLNITNPYDPNETIKGNYTVKYYLDGVEQTADEVYREKEIWIYADDIAVDSGDVNINGKYGNGFICEEPTSVPATVKSGTTIEVKYIPNPNIVEAELTINKTYVPDKPSTVESAVFTFTNTMTNQTKTWNGSGTIALTLDDVYNVTEVAPKGYLKVKDFQIKYDSATGGLILIGNDSNVSIAAPGSFTLNVINPYDPNETIKGNYTVKYYLDGVEQTADEVYREKEIWIYADDIAVDSGDVNIVNKYGNAYICSSHNTVPATVKSGTVIEVEYVPNMNETHNIMYMVNYHKDNQITTDVVEEFNVWIGKTELLLKPFQVFPGYEIKSTTPGGLTEGVSMIADGTVIDVYLAKDPTKTHDIAYTIVYEDADGNRTSVPGTKTVHQSENTAEVPITEFDFNKFPGQAVSSVKIDSTTVLSYPVTVIKDATNEIVVRFEKITPSTEQITYTIEYYEYNPETQACVTTPVIETIIVEVPYGQGTTPVTNSDIKTDKFPNQTVDEIKIEGKVVTLPQNVADQGVVQVYFHLDTSKATSARYMVHYMKDGVLDSTSSVLKRIPAGDTRIAVEYGDITVKKFDGYQHTGFSVANGERIAIGGIVEVTYTKDLSLTKDVQLEYDIYIGDPVAGYARYETRKVEVTIWEGYDSIEVVPDVTLDKNGNVIVEEEITINKNHYKTEGNVILKVDEKNAVYYTLYASDIEIELDGLVKVSSGRQSAGMFDFVGNVVDTASFGGLSIDGHTSATGAIKFTIKGPVPVNILNRDIVFTIRQDLSSSGGLTYDLDQTVYTVTIQFHQNPAGELYTTVPNSPGRLEFYNVKK